MTVFGTVLNMSITGTYIAAAIIVIRLAMKKLPKKYSYALWVILGIRLLCPFSFSSAVSVFNMIKPDVTENQMMYIPENIVTGNVPQVTLPPASDLINDNSDSLAPQPNNSVQPMQIVSAVCNDVWLIGAAGMALYTVISYLLVRRKVKNALYLQDNIYICGDIDSPFVYGVIKPRIYLPDNIPADETEFILAHERAHIRRGDHIVKLIAMAALCVHWFNPMAWISYRLMIKDMELSCDEIAVNGFDRDVRKDYAETLLNMSMRQNKIVLGGILGFGESNIRSRIKSVLAAKKPRVIVTAAAVLAVAISSVCLLTNASSKLVDGNAVSAEVTQVTELASEGGDITHTLDGAKAARLINRLSAKETEAGLLTELVNTSVYNLTLHYDDGGYAAVTIYSPLHYDDRALFPKYMAVETEDDAKVYTLSDRDYDKLAKFMTEPFEMFPAGIYVNNMNEALTVVVINRDNEKLFEYRENGELLWQGTAYADYNYEAHGTRAVWGDFAEGQKRFTGNQMRYLGNYMIDAEFGSGLSITPPEGVFVRRKAPENKELFYNSPEEAVTAHLEWLKEEDYILSLDIVSVSVNDEESEKLRALYREDERLKNNIFIFPNAISVFVVDAVFDVDYDETKMTNAEGRVTVPFIVARIDDGYFISGRTDSLYNSLREDDMYGEVYEEPVPDDGIGEAVNEEPVEEAWAEYVPPALPANAKVYEYDPDNLTDLPEFKMPIDSYHEYTREEIFRRRIEIKAMLDCSATGELPYMHRKDSAYTGECRRLENIKVAGWEVKDEKFYDDSWRYELTVTLDISESGSEAAPVGRNDYTLVCEPGEDRMFLPLRKVGEYDDGIILSNLRIPYADFCTYYTAYFRRMFTADTVTDFSSPVMPENYSINETAFCAYFAVWRAGGFADKYVIPYDEFDSELKRILGFSADAIRAKESNLYNADDDCIHIDGRGTSWICGELAEDIYSAADNTHTVTINYYKDDFYLVLSQVYRYTVRENDDGTYSMLKIEHLYKSDLPILGGCV